MRDDQAQIALADAMQLHNERLERANAEVRRLRAELETAVTRQDQVRAARLHFMQYVAPQKPGPRGHIPWPPEVG